MIIDSIGVNINKVYKMYVWEYSNVRCIYVNENIYVGVIWELI